MALRAYGEVELCFYPDRDLRRQLARPFGPVIKGGDIVIDKLSRFHRVITVGDVVSSLVLSKGLTPSLAVVDGVTKRTSKVDQVRADIVVRNEAGVIRESAMEVIRDLILMNMPKVVMVRGEEDLLALPCMMYAEDGDIVVYGQPNAGAVLVEVNHFIKWKAWDLFHHMKVKKC